MAKTLKPRFRGQVQPISAIILTGIVLLLVAVAYMWGVPLIEKRTTMTEFSTMKRFIANLEERISEIARSGAGEVDMEIRQGHIRLLPYDSGNGNNSIIIEFLLDQPLTFPNSTLYLGSVSFEDVNGTGSYGEASPAVAKVTGQRHPSGYKLSAEVRYRELERQSQPKRGYLIALCPATDATCSSSMSGNHMISMSFDKNLIQSGAASNGGDLVTTYINVRLS